MTAFAVKGDHDRTTAILETALKIRKSQFIIDGEAVLSRGGDLELHRPALPQEDHNVQL